MNKFTKSALLLSAATLFGAALPAQAQVTTGQVGGVVTTESGSPITGATVTIRDTRTGVTRTIATNSNGSFSRYNLPVGGPYEISVASDGYQGERVEGVTLSASSSSNFNFDLATATAEGDEIVVVGQRTVLADVAAGPSVSFTAADIADLPSTGRDIKDVIRLDPRIFIDETFGNGIFCAGNSNRSNSLTVDSVRQNDDFGLNGNGYPTQRLPFPFDIVEQVSAELAPFDVQYAGFTGCNVNVVTRSGGNEFQGRLSYDYIGDDFGGSSIEGSEINTIPIGEKTYSGFVSGPIIKDRLFFSAAYEKFQSGDGSSFGPEDSASANPVSGITTADVTAVQQILQSVYGFDAGTFGGDFNVEDERYFVKLTGYITDNQRVEVSYQDTLGNDIAPQNNSTSRRNLGLTSNWYDRSEKLQAYNGALFSDWTDKLSTELRLTYNDRRTGQDPLSGGEFSQFEIGTAGGGTIFVGPDSFRHANELSSEAWNFKATAYYDAGDHQFKFGFEQDDYTVFNLFVPFAEGQVEFDSIADLQAQTPSEILYQNAFSNDENDGAANFSRKLQSLYIQDDWALTDNFDLIAGLRLDWYTMDDTPSENPAFEQRYGFANTSTLDGKSILQPRLGFKWRPDWSEDLQVSGGVARFSGGDPAVWVSNGYSNSGNLLGFVVNTDPAVINGFDGQNIPQTILDANAASAAQGRGNVNALSPDFDIPSVWRFNLGFEKRDLNLSNVGLGEGWLVGADVLYSYTDDPVNWENIALSQIGTAPDGRPIYQGQDRLDPDCPANVVGGPGNDLSNCRNRREDIILTNSGATPTNLVLSAYFDKEWELSTGTEIHMNLGYAYTDAEDLSPATSSTASSNFENVARRDYNNPAIAPSNYSVPHRITMRLDLEHEFIKDAPTKLGIFGQYNAGRHYSFTLDTNGGSDGIAGRDNIFGDSDDSERRSLLYVPTGMADPLLDVGGSDPTALADFLDFIETSPSGLSEFRGQIAPRNAFDSPWWGKVDMRLQQTIPLPKVLGNDKLRLILDIDNLTNLLNDEWGVYREIPFGGSGYNVAVAEYNLNSATNQYQVTNFNGGLADFNRNLGISLWKIKIGARYEF